MYILTLTDEKFDASIKDLIRNFRSLTINRLATVKTGHLKP